MIWCQRKKLIQAGLRQCAHAVVWVEPGVIQVLVGLGQFVPCGFLVFKNVFFPVKNTIMYTFDRIISSLTLEAAYNSYIPSFNFSFNVCSSWF